ncbi:MAG: hypothetical protein IPJ65_01665 [Archangiaceae bacterium]|nr:hypothetical protein [Archangiaceae bacterium]
MSLERRITAILGSPRPTTPLQVRTSPAFAERFRAEAARSGLTLELAPQSVEQLVRLCLTCGAQNGRLARACFNCQTELADEAPPPPRAAPRRPSSEARWQNLVTRPAPLDVRVPLAAARFTPYPVQQVDSRAVLDRFLAVFVEREKAPRPAQDPVGRFDSRTALDRFLSVFIERS